MSNSLRLDDTDRRLLRTLQADGRISNAELADLQSRLQQAYARWDALESG